jgi:predicted amidohydrolase
MTKKASLVGIQTIPKKDGNTNIREALALTDEALRNYKYVDMLVLPEYFYEMDIKKKDSIGAYPEELLSSFSSRARAHETYILAGSVLHRRADGKLYNTAVLFDRKGEIVGSYDKIHLFDVLDGVGDDKESGYCERGDHLFMHEADFGKIGVSICYDIRFPELARTMALQGTEYLFVPAAFYSPRIDHWTDLLRAAALHNSMYVMGVNLYGKWDASNVFCGRSLLADPWGVAIAQASDGASIIQAFVDTDYPRKTREAVGSFHNRVPVLYDIPKATE